jgi:hypothetical protein
MFDANKTIFDFAKKRAQRRLSKMMLKHYIFLRNKGVALCPEAYGENWLNHRIDRSDHDFVEGVFNLFLEELFQLAKKPSPR